MCTERKKALEKLEKLREEGIKDSSMLEHLINNWLSSDDANDALDSLLDEYELNDDEDEVEEEDEEDEEDNIFIDHEG